MLSTLNNWVQPIKDALYNAYTGIVNFVSNPFDNLSGHFKSAENPDKVKLDQLRNQHFLQINAESQKASPDYMQVAKNISTDTKKYVNAIIADEIKKLGKPPCKFTVITLGSLARKESGPITDLEIGIVMEEKTVENYSYFYQLSQNISDRLFLLGEHPDIGGKGLRMDEADNAPPHLRFFARNATREQAQELLNQAIANREFDKIPYEGSRPFLATPEEFASYSQAKFTQNRKQLNNTKRKQYQIELNKALKDPKNAQLAKTAEGKKKIANEVQFWVDQMYRPFSPRELRTANDAGKKLGRNMDYLYGNRALYNKFIHLREKNFSRKEQNGKTLRQNMAKSYMSEDIISHIQKGKSIFVTGELGKTLDIKRELYRFVEQFATNLGFYHNLKTQNSLEIVQQLKAKGILSPSLADKMSDFIQFASGLRLKEQSVIKRQGFAAYFDQAEFDEDKEDLEKEIQLAKDSLAYMQTLAKKDPNAIAAKKRDLVKLEDKYHHMLDMAPGKIFSSADIELLKNKYLPIGQEIFKAAQEWTQNKDKLGFDSVPAVSAPVAPVVSVPTTFTPAMKNAMDYMHQHPNGFFPALAKLKQEQSNLTKDQLLSFVKQCHNEKLLTPADCAKIAEIKARHAAAAA
ncbi:DUF294 nucleotidyltransferase-like domain-containing protein [Candidatus Berkiella aquae]|uniref:Protein-PII uridylyltransferase N-terminal domain-containing protein n=1 Tax=Candidatus Berkiella aquae TaxID=295108 RepID=A0A0Q9YJR0_9GAMM|nr:DUF294 nucleotidyltransferase-like domain-containing protein [Candidatus Berkiella aquae]MCS5711337.1 hypothetical protein [Candidatus Berkiella aquae]